MQKTLILLKPDCLRRGLTGAVISRIEGKGYSIADMKMTVLDEAVLRRHYAHIAERPFFPRVVHYMTSGPVMAMVLSGPDVIEGMRALIGATNCDEAEAGTIRGDFGSGSDENLIHASDSPESAEIEIRRFFS